MNHHPSAARRDWRRAALAGGALLGLLPMATAATRPATVAAAEDSPVAPRVPAAAARIEIKGYVFSPATLAVPAGTTVTWINRDDEPHTVTESDKAFTSPGLDAEETFSHTFSTPGTYTYFCKLHPEMTATIIVK